MIKSCHAHELHNQNHSFGAKEKKTESFAKKNICISFNVWKYYHVRHNDKQNTISSDQQTRLYQFETHIFWINSLKMCEGVFFNLKIVDGPNRRCKTVEWIKSLCLSDWSVDFYKHVMLQLSLIMRLPHISFTCRSSFSIFTWSDGFLRLISA